MDGEYADGAAGRARLSRYPFGLKAVLRATSNWTKLVLLTAFAE